VQEANTATLPRHASGPLSFQAAENSSAEFGPEILVSRATRRDDPELAYVAAH
jgi:hypothetical protein